MKKQILCIDDDVTIQTLVEATFREFDVVAATTLGDAQGLLEKGRFSALIIDIELPDGDGLRFLTEITKQEKWQKVPILILTGHGDISNKVMAFSFGAEDFLTKPFDPVELNARVSAKIRKNEIEKNESQIRKVGDATIDFGRQKVFGFVDGREKDLNLTSIELKILSLLTKRLEQVYSRHQIIDQVWGETFITDRTVDSHIAHLRQKMMPTMLVVETAKNFGYRAVLKESTKND